MKTKSSTLQKVNAKAWELVKKMALSWKEAIKQAWAWFKKQLVISKATTAQFFQITFVKQSTGEITTRIGSNAKMKEENLLFFSISDNGFRSAIAANILEVVEIENATLNLQ